MEESEEILYREEPSAKFEKYIYIGSAYPEDMHNSHPQFESLKDWEHFVADDNYAEILVNFAFCQYIYSQERESFEDLFGEKLYRIFEERNEEIGAAGWFWGIDIPVFSGLDLRDKEIEESTYFENGEHKEILFTDGSEVKVVDEKSGFSGGYYISESEYPQLLEDIKELRKIFKS